MSPVSMGCPVCKKDWVSVADTQSIINNGRCFTCLNPKHSLVQTYIHGDKESMYDAIKDIKFDNEDAERMAAFATSEIKLEFLISHETGRATLVSVDGKRILQ